MIRSRWVASTNRVSVRRQAACLLHPYLVRAVDHDLGDVGVGEERIDRTVAENVVGDLLQQLQTVGPGQRNRLLLVECPLEHLHDAELQLGVAHLTVVQRRAETLDDLVVELAPQILAHLFTMAVDGDVGGLGCFHPIGETH